MDLDFELILTVIFLISGIFWLLNKFVLRQEEGVVEFTGSLAPILAIVLIIRSFMVEPFQIPSSSMAPTLLKGDFILVNKWSYGLRLPVLRSKILDVGEPQRGDVMVFFPPHQDRYFIKRVVGLPGDEIHLLNGVLFINGEKMSQQKLADEPSAPRSVVMEEDLGGVRHAIQKRTSPTRLSQNMTVIVPQGHYFMMGDNRDNSSDSRVWGPVPEQRIVGRAFARWMFWDERGSLPSFARAGRIQ